ncbi:MAG TPA: hypothetical protein VIC08_13375 [Cellvibrionaceae bacterium]
MADIHIADFHKDLAKILCQLYAGFPRKLTLYVEDISGADTPDEFGLHSTRHQACFATLLWLADEGYVRYSDTIRQEAVDQATLTHKGFTLLSMQLNCQSLLDTGITHTAAKLDGRPLTIPLKGDFAPTIDLLRNAIKGGSSAAIEQIVQIILRHQ